MQLDGTESAGQVAARIGIAVGGLLLALLIVAAIVRPDMMMGALHLVMHGLGAMVGGH